MAASGSDIQPIGVNLAAMARVSESNVSGWRNVTTLESAFAVNSPRLTPRGAALPGWLIQTAVVVLWVALFAQVFLQVGAGLWSIGIAYIVYWFKSRSLQAHWIESLVPHRRGQIQKG